MSHDYDKEFFVRTWGKDGYYEYFNYGVGIEKVMQICIDPFNNCKSILEIGSGGGTFTKRLWAYKSGLTCIDVIPQPENLYCCEYIELPDQDYYCSGVAYNSYDFCFCYNVFCHLSNDAIKEYLKSVNHVLVPGGDFVFMISAYGRGLPDSELGTLLDMGHFAQDERTLLLVIGEGWEIISENMIPEHRDIIIHLRKKI